MARKKSPGHMTPANVIESMLGGGPQTHGIDPTTALLLAGSMGTGKVGKVGKVAKAAKAAGGAGKGGVTLESMAGAMGGGGGSTGGAASAAAKGGGGGGLLKSLGGGKALAGGGIGILLGLLLGQLLKETVTQPQEMQTQADLALSGQPPPELIAQQAMAPQMQSQNDLLFMTLMQQMGGSGGITPQEMAL